MPKIQRRGNRHWMIWIFQPILYILRVVYRLLKPLVRKIFRHLRSYLGRLLPTFRIVQTLMSYIEPWKPVILPIIGRLIFLIKRPFSLEINDDKELETVVYIEPRGLQNLGNTCYFNSMMQPLTYTNLLKELLLKSPTTGELTESLRCFYTDMFSGESGPFSPRSLHQIFARECSRFNNRNQHDSHECLRNFLDNIRKEERRQLKTTVPGNSQDMLKLTTVDRVFGGQLITVYVCMRCRGPYHLFEPCLDISLPICFERRPESCKQSLSTTGKNSQRITVGNGPEVSEDDTSKISELEKTDMDNAIMETKVDEDDCNEVVEKEDAQAEKDEEEETEEETDEEEPDKEDSEEVEEDDTEAEQNSEKKAHAKQKEDQIEKRVFELDGKEVGYCEEVNVLKQRKDEKNNEKEVKVKEEAKEEDDGSNRKNEADEKGVKHQNEVRVKVEQQLEEENIEDVDKKNEEAQNLGKIPDDQEKHEIEKLEDYEHIKSKKKRGNRSISSRKKRPCSNAKMFEEILQARGQSNSMLVNSDWNLQSQSCDWEHSKQQAQNLNLSLYDDTVETESAIGAVHKSQERSDVSRSNAEALMTSPQDEGRSQENDSYKAAIRSLMEPLSLRSATKFNNVDSKQKSVEECLMYFTREEHIRKEYLCRDCRDEHPENNGIDTPLTSATKQTLIFSPPAVLTIHLKRFELKPGGSVKRSDMIKYEEFLDIAPYCSVMCLRNDPPCPNIWYSLYAVVVHSGSLDSGHYTAYVKVQRDEQLGSRRFLQTEFFDRDVTKEQLIEMVMNKERKSSSSSATGAVWYCANDSKISKVTLENVLSQEAYLLFYERL